MSSMYDKIMDLPLFKGIGEEMLSQMLEKTSVEFLKFTDNDLIHKNGEEVGGLDFVLNGHLSISHKIKDFEINVEEKVGEGEVIGACNLFGLYNNYTADIIAEGLVNIMRIYKNDYISILMSDKIYMLNYVNYICASTQKKTNLLQSFNPESITSVLTTLANSLTGGGKRTLILEGSDFEIARYCGISINELKEWEAKELSNERILLTEKGLLLKN